MACPWNEVDVGASTEMILMLDLTHGKLQAIGRTLAFVLSEEGRHWRFSGEKKHMLTYILEGLC